MEQTQPSRLSAADRARTARDFGTWLADRMRDRGFVLPPHGRGGVRRLAEKAGVSPSLVSTLLRGENPNPSPESLRLIAAALQLRFGEVLIRAGILTPGELADVQSTSADAAPAGTEGRPPLTPEEIAASQGITDPTKVSVLAATIRALQDRPDERAGD
jgi:transcriptional regulator with XRE-family HTH domain